MACSSMLSRSPAWGVSFRCLTGLPRTPTASASLGDGFVDGKLGGVFSGVVGSIDLSGGEDAGFDGADTSEAPAVFGDGLGEIDFESADGCEGRDDAITVSVEGLLFGIGEDEGLAGESVTVGVEPSAVRGFGVWGVGLTF